MKFSIITLGCKVNTYESEYIKEKFKERKYQLVDSNEPSDIIIINTCTVTNQSDAKSRKMIRSSKRNNPNAIIVVCGCASEHHKGNIVDTPIDILIGNYYKSKIVDFVEEYKITNKKINTFTNLNKVPFENMKINNFLNKTRAFVKIQDGCNNYCSYCIIPYMRGTIRSKDINTCYEEIKCLTDKGYQEIVLTGIHTGSYGYGTNYDLVDLIKKISTLNKLKRIRISSIEITELNNKFLDELKNNKKICNHLHIPIQSGCDKILKLMNRKYNIDTFINIVNKIRSIRPNISITTDLIVGFPTENEIDFKETLNNLKKVEFSKIHTFPYSKRDKTPAALMSQVSETIKKERVNTILKLSDELESKYYNIFLNETLDCLIEEIKDNYSIGHTDNYIKIKINNQLEHNKFYKIKIKDIVNKDVIGEDTLE